MKKIAVLTAILAVSSGSVYAQQTKILTAEKHNEYGLVYSLPVTALRITVTAERETRKAGPYWQYARHYLGTTDVIDRDEVAWSIKNVSVIPVGVKEDDATQYLMQLKAGALTYIGVSSDGMLLSINAEPEDQVDLISGTMLNQGKMLHSDGPTDAYLKYVDMDFVSAQNSMRQAEMVASSLMDVRDAYLSLTRGTADNVPTDGRQLELMLNSLKEQENAFTHAFTGSITVEEFSAQYLFIPEDEGEEVLFRLSDFNGFVGADDFSGSPIYIRTEIIKEGSLPLDVNGVEKKFPKDGIVYAIPGTAKITISTSSQPIFSKEIEFSQFGTTFGLAPSLFSDKKAPSFARFNSATGALIEIGKVTVAESPKEY